MKGILKKHISAICVLLVVLGLATVVFSDDTSAQRQPPPEVPPLPLRAPHFRRVLAATALKPDPSGANTGGAADVAGGSANGPTADDMKNMATNEPLAVKLADVIGHNKVALNIAWTLLCGFLVMFMQTGFAMVETGFTRAKNASHTMAMNIMIFCLRDARLLGMRLCPPDGRRRRRAHLAGGPGS